jgi:hypothetical protein
VTDNRFVTRPRTIGEQEYRWKLMNQDGRMVLRMTIEVVCRRAPAPVS